MKKITLLIGCLFVFTASEIVAQENILFFDEADAVFSNYVVNGSVDYKALQSNPKQLDKALMEAKGVRVTTSEPALYKAFWINAYNLAVIKGIVNSYPLKSPLDKDGFFDKTTYDLGGKSITLNDIENMMLRAKFDDARVHFVLVCGAKGCPPLLSKSYLPSNVEKLLEQQTIKALNNSSFIKVSEGKVAFSEIFKWYKEDFVKEGQTEIDFLNKYRKKIVPTQAKVTYYSYDWRVNSK